MRIEPYELLAQISAGPDGVAYRAKGPRGEGVVEVRTLAPARQDSVRWSQLVRRVHLARMLEHPGARRILEFDPAAEPPRLVLAGAAGLALGPSLAGRLPLPPLEAVSLTRDLAGVLKAAHRLGLGHGQLDPTTIALPEGQIQLDFTGAATQEQAHPAPPISLELLSDDVARLAGLLVYFLCGRLLHPGDMLPETLPTVVRSLLGDVLRCPASDRPPIGEMDNRLRQMTDLLQTHASLARTALGGPEVVPPALDATAKAVRTPDRLGRFRLLEKLGEGGMGEVYRAEDVSTGQIVAVKTLLPEMVRRPEAVQRFRKEARLLAEVNNPYVANLLEVNEDAGVHYLAVEFVAGHSLAQRLDARGPLEESFALAVTADVCRALIDAHARGIIHRDIKPENILLLAEADAGPLTETVGAVGARQFAKLTDFGLARHVVESDSLHLTRTGAIVGTPFYLSPEQCTGTALDARSDVYGLGATLFHLLTGRPPFVGDSPLVLINHHCNTAAPPLEALNPAFSNGVCRIVEKTLAKAPEHRYADAAALLHDIERMVRGEPSRLAAHPLLPQADPARVVRFDFHWDLASTAEELWPHVSNTERLNRAINLSAVEFSTRVDEDGKVRRQGRLHKLGLEIDWEEHPFEWVEARRLGVLRQFRSGPFRWLLSAVELSPRPGGGTTLTHRISLEPSGVLGRAFAAVEVGVKTRRAMDRVYRRIDAAVAGKRGMTDPFEEPPRLGKAQQHALDDALDRLTGHGLNPTVVEQLGAYLATAPPQEAARIRPIALARRLGLDENAVLATCLHGAREGLLVLLWDLLCPLCRIPSEIKDTLKALHEHGRCEACNADYELDFTCSVELIFRVHPSIREVELGTFCVGGPAHSPHVAAQVRVAPGEQIELELALGAGAYRLRGPQLPVSLEARVDAVATTGRWELDLGRLKERSGSLMLLRPGGQVLALHNPQEQELVVRLERTASRDDAVTAARAAALGLFRELFPGEVLSPGRLMRLATVTLLATELTGVKGLPETEAFTHLHAHVTRLERLAREKNGALVKAVGDGALAAFHEPAAAVRTALDLARANPEPMRLALHRGPALAATINDHLDYFGATVRQIATMLQWAEPGEQVLSQAVMDDPSVSALLHARERIGEAAPVDLPGTELLHRFRGG